MKKNIHIAKNGQCGYSTSTDSAFESEANAS